jgi:dihydroorotase
MARPMLIRGGRVICPASDLDQIADVLVGEDGLVAEVGPSLEAKAGADAQVVDAAGKLVLPGLVDIHVHFREPGQEYKETVESGSRSAVAGGFTTVACMANTDPVNDRGTVTRLMVERARTCGLARVLPVGAVSKGLKGAELAEIGDMLAEGAVAVSDDGKAVMDAHLMRCALEYTRGLGVPVIAHEEDCNLSGGSMNEGPVSARLGLAGIPNAAEDVMVARDILLAELTGGHLHVAHVSTAGSVRMIRDARARDIHVTAEATPHHFWLTDEEVASFDPNVKMAPPLRAAADVAAIVEGLVDGTIDAIATDHAPHGTVDKEVEFELASNGIVGLETSWGLTQRLVRDGRLTLKRAVELLTTGPASVLGLDVGTLRVGAPGDLVVVDPDGFQEVDVDRLHTKGRNTPFGGWVLPSRVERTVFGGKTVYLWDGDRGAFGGDL